MTLHRLLHPHTVEDFFSSVWEREHLHITREENPELLSFFEELITFEDIDELLTTTYATRQRRWDSIRMGQGGIMISPEMYLSNRNGPMADVDVDRVLELHRAGASIILNSVHEALRPVGELCRALSDSMGIHVHGNVYITPPAAQGFPVHFDSHDVFLLQIVGEKRWELAHSQVPLATFEAQNEDQLAPQGTQTTIHLQSGELLYIPRGVLHEGVTSKEMSAHLTIGMNPFTWAQLLHDLVEQVETTDAEFRSSVPTGLRRVGDTGEDYQVTLSRLTRKLYVSNELVSRSVDRITRERSDRGPARLRGVLYYMHSVDRICSDTRLRPCGTQAPDMTRTDGELVLRFGDRVLTLPSFTEVHVRALFAGQPICASDLPPGIDREGRLVLVRRLVEEGLLVPIERV
ncbi:cupin domain-containing protein [Kribbella sp. VKM Ac-2566]|uniref:cupin domain-containing protein n=1 Tax=Kribbella sp. VKM Ac-2566 TaxID=2512218 RepID=UPI0010636B0E|nr:cupin domain-containing protein [Kribbella sp. VKM Ac-2566]TDW91129.1 cupin superfamily protein [Kribbella sp. VKM Ac-2566]